MIKRLFMLALCSFYELSVGQLAVASSRKRQIEKIAQTERERRARERAEERKAARRRERREDFEGGVGNSSTQDAAGNDVFAAGYDVVTAIPVPANNATAIAVKVFDMTTSNRREVLRALAQLKRKTVNTLTSDDVSFLSDPDYEMINVVLRDLFAHIMATKYRVLNQADFNLIFEKNGYGKISNPRLLCPCRTPLRPP
jgi:hypothetical protein